MQKRKAIKTSGQVDPKLLQLPQIKTAPYVIHGCLVSFSPTADKADEPIQMAKEILLSAYGTRIASY